MAKTASAEQHIRALLEHLGENVQRSGLQDTPRRVVESLSYLTQGNRGHLTDIKQNALFPCDNNEMVTLANIEFYSLCEHHLLPFFGRCHIAYLPQGQMIGLSKIPGVVDHFSKRLQVQEQLTQQIAEGLLSITAAGGVAVMMEAQHLCMMMRGIEKQGPTITTTAMLGAFKKDANLRTEFINLVRNS
jgi:GTP cyclohydrolase I